VPELDTNKGRENEMGGACGKNGEKMNAYRLLVGKPEGKRPLGRPRRRWLDNIKMDLVGDRRRALVNSVLNFWLP
jgi:hypothetical protein